MYGETPHAQEEGIMAKLVTCKRCGRNDLQWKQSKAGKWYLTYDEGAAIFGDGGKQIKTLYPAHECLVRDGELTEKRASLIVRGRITTTDEEQSEAQALLDALEAEALIPYHIKVLRQMKAEREI
jgi:hypothetical protein